MFNNFRGVLRGCHVVVRVDTHNCIRIVIRFIGSGSGGASSRARYVSLMPAISLALFVTL